jgi:hypothetical protein
MPTSDNLNDMDSWSNRRAYVNREFLANRAQAQVHATEAVQAAKPKLVSLRDLQRTMEQHAAEHPEIDVRPGDDRAMRMPRRD